MSHRSSHYWLTSTLIVVCLAAADSTLVAQVSSSGLRPFVTGLIPVTGRNGAVGGVLVDSKGVVRNSGTRISNDLRAQRQKALQVIPSAIGKKSKLRKVSLRGLQEAIIERVRAKKPIGQEIQFLAGLQRIEYIFADPNRKDIILAGPAEAWQIGKSGEVVSQSSEAPVLHLDDLVVALRSAKSEKQISISCSIDPSKNGLQRLQSALQRRRAASGRQLQSILGPQIVTLTGANPECHFSQVLVAADVRMKRLAMNLERPPIAGMPSYMQRLAMHNGSPENLMPRWWLAPNYEQLQRDDLGLTWRIAGPGVKVQTRDGRLVRGQVQEQDGDHPAAVDWAKAFTEKFSTLAGQIPVFGQLRGCMDLSLAATIIDQFELEQLAECDLGLLVKPTPLKVVAYPAAKTIPTQASFIQQGRNRIVSLSGGVAMEWNGLVENAAEVASLSKFRRQHVRRGDRWWWD